MFGEGLVDFSWWLFVGEDMIGLSDVIELNYGVVFEFGVVGG